MTEVEMAAEAVIVCVASTAVMHEQADEYSSRLAQWDAMGTAGSEEEVVAGAVVASVSGSSVWRVNVEEGLMWQLPRFRFFLLATVGTALYPVTVVEMVDTWVVVYSVAVAMSVSYEVTVSSSVEIWVVRETTMST